MAKKLEQLTAPSRAVPAQGGGTPPAAPRDDDDGDAALRTETTQLEAAINACKGERMAPAR
eukprot:3821421-Pyramimonas_sp.AAC.1